MNNPRNKDDIKITIFFIYPPFDALLIYTIFTMFFPLKKIDYKSISSIAFLIISIEFCNFSTSSLLNST